MLGGGDGAVEVRHPRDEDDRDIEIPLSNRTQSSSPPSDGMWASVTIASWQRSASRLSAEQEVMAFVLAGIRHMD